MYTIKKNRNKTKQTTRTTRNKTFATERLMNEMYVNSMFSIKYCWDGVCCSTAQPQKQMGARCSDARGAGSQPRLSNVCSQGANSPATPPQSEVRRKRKSRSHCLRQCSSSNIGTHGSTYVGCRMHRKSNATAAQLQ